MKTIYKISIIILIINYLFIHISCKKIDEYNQEPDIECINDGIVTSVFVGYCASVAMSAFRGDVLPQNIAFVRGNRDEFHSSGLIMINTSTKYPQPFGHSTGQIVIGGLWDREDKGVITIVSTDIRLLEGELALNGLYTVPVMLQDDGSILTLFAREDIIIGEGSDTILAISFTKPQFDLEMDRLDTEIPDNVYTAVKQNAWFVSIDQNGTPNAFLDDEFTINGGGQMAEATEHSAGVIYHAIIGTSLNYTECNINPLDGQALIQYVVAGEYLDFKTLLLDFDNICDGKASVIAATGKYIRWNGRRIPLDLN